MSGWDPAAYRRACESAWRTLVAQSRGFRVILTKIGGGHVGPGVVFERDHERAKHGETSVAVRLEPGGWVHLGEVSEVVSEREWERRGGPR